MSHRLFAKSVAGILGQQSNHGKARRPVPVYRPVTENTKKAKVDSEKIESTSDVKPTSKEPIPVSPTPKAPIHVKSPQKEPAHEPSRKTAHKYKTTRPTVYYRVVSESKSTQEKLKSGEENGSKNDHTEKQSQPEDTVKKVDLDKLQDAPAEVATDQDNCSSTPPTAEPTKDEDVELATPQPAPYKLQGGMYKLPEGCNLKMRRETYEDSEDDDVFAESYALKHRRGSSTGDGGSLDFSDDDRLSPGDALKMLIARFPGSDFETTLNGEIKSSYIVPMEEKVSLLVSQENGRLVASKFATQFRDCLQLLSDCLRFLHTLLSALVGDPDSFKSSSVRVVRRSLGCICRLICYAYSQRWLLTSLGLSMGNVWLQSSDMQADSGLEEDAFSMNTCAVSSPAFDVLLGEEWIWQAVFLDPDDGSSFSQLAMLHSRISLISPSTRVQRVVEKRRHFGHCAAVEVSSKLSPERRGQLLSRVVTALGSSFSAGDVWDMDAAMSASAPLTYLTYINTPDTGLWLNRVQLIRELKTTLSPWKVLAEPFMSVPMTSPLFITWSLLRSCLSQRKPTDRDQISLFLRDFVSRSRWAKNSQWAPGSANNIKSKSPALLGLVTNVLRLIGIIQARIELDEFPTIANESCRFLRYAIAGELNESQDLPWINIVLSSVVSLYLLEKTRSEDSLWTSPAQVSCLYLLLRYLWIFMIHLKSPASPSLGAIVNVLRWMGQEGFLAADFFSADAPPKALVLYDTEHLDWRAFHEITKADVYQEFLSVIMTLRPLMSRPDYSMFTPPQPSPLPEDRFWLLDRSINESVDAVQAELPKDRPAEGVMSYDILHKLSCISFKTCVTALDVVVNARLDRLSKISLPPLPHTDVPVVQPPLQKTTPEAASLDGKERVVVIDGSNVAMSFGTAKSNDRIFSSEGIQIAIDYFLRRNFHVVAILPDLIMEQQEECDISRVRKLNLNYNVAKLPDNLRVLQSLKSQGLLQSVPTKDYDDSYILEFARIKDGLVLSNDQFRDKIKKDGFRIRTWLKRHVISYAFIQNELVINPDFSFEMTEYTGG
eukprot:Blabericola_migrator_1__5389@NODE_275_length_10491_cov_112_748561_g228_i0_p2_GENE_NODE_275_length_10491_cov_112_748561_g228_i0NODE_275_length_10491_cov_112_748561_g228_i0_p2_ORF_typecomplete_len1055_score161_01RNase_Zc3h12a/PF11977_8/1_1e04RNase_Zc3h12a/PF11977_8/3_8e30PRORP/PF16953_5/1_8e11EST1_DNA_bind/PF10373_9/6_3e03EST1_DNA_bind/PF10373_9/6_8EST1_DNA_bind/PF10373_9/5_6_NODE_275_length_10491_cov_112_748561_g228_i065199683